MFTELSKAIQANKKLLILFGVLWALMLGVFLFTSIGTESYRFFLQLRRFFPSALAATVAIYLWEKDQLPGRGMMPELIIFCLWLLSYNVTSFISNKGITTNLNNYMDITFAGYVFALLVFIKILFSFWGSGLRVMSAVMTFVEFSLIVIPIASILYFLNYGSTITSPAAIALLQTNPNEAKEYLLQNIGAMGGAILIACSVLIAILFYGFNLHVKSGKKDVPSRKKLVLLSILLIATGVYLPKCFIGTGVVKSLCAAGDYLHSARQFQLYHKEHFSSLFVELPSAGFSKPSTIIVLVGESYGRNFMSAYGYTANDTTPWLKAVTSNDSQHFIKYNHAYSSFGSTMQSLERALTEKNQYNDKEFNRSFSIIDLAKKAGYKTYWFSNQGIKNSTETPVQLVAKTADISYWIEQEESTVNRVMYDGDLIHCLEMVNPNENNFVVLHVMGCHELTLHRFPEDRTQFGQPGVFDLISNYEDAMAYSDWVWQQIYEYGRKKLNLQAMLIFSDHGANPYRKRTAENIPFINVRIPLIFYLSDEYQSLYPDSAKALRDNQNKYFSNDLIYEAVGGLLNIKSTHLDQKNNIAGSKYQFTKDMVKTDLGRKFVKDDVHEEQIEY